MDPVRRRIASLRLDCALVVISLSAALVLLPQFAAAQRAEPPTPAPNTADLRSPNPLAQIEVGEPTAERPQPILPPQVGPAHAPTITSPAVRPVQKESVDLAVALETRGDLNLHGLSLNSALFTIAELWNVNIVAGDVRGTVNGVFKQAPLREILDSILLSNGYNYRAVGKSLVISSIADLGQINPFFQSATIPVQSADVDEIVEGAKLLSTPQGQVRALKSARSIVVLDFPDRVQMIRQFVSAIDGASDRRFSSDENRRGIPLEVGYFRTQYITARAAEQVLQTVLSKDGRVAVMEQEDRLLVTDYAENLLMVEKVIARIDCPRPQVRITALIYDISLQDTEQLGINWQHRVGSSVEIDADGTRTRDTALNIDSIMQVPFQEGAVGGTMQLLSLSRHLDLGAVVLALQGCSDARLLADPHVAVLENEEAVFQSVSEIPYQQLTETQQGGSIGTTAFKQAGITLKVRPKIAADGVIQMEVTPEFSRLTGFTPGDNQPIIDVRSASTTLTIANRQTVVIGGLRQRSDIGDFRGVPYLKDLKLFGRLFRSRDTDVRESELVVFIMPEIIHCADRPTFRQQLVDDTIRCRLDQVPEAEGCPPCCRRLPLDPTLSYPAPLELQQEELPFEEAVEPADALPSPEEAEVLLPQSAAEIHSAEFQFGAAGRSKLVRALVAEGHLRRLPGVESPAAIVAQRFATGTPPHTSTTPSITPADRPQARPVRR
jgi:general secretion pathway protein D